MLNYNERLKNNDWLNKKYRFNNNERENKNGWQKNNEQLIDHCLINNLKYSCIDSNSSEFARDIINDMLTLIAVYHIECIDSNLQCKLYRLNWSKT
jgi:hypothetical protein